jgi:hypothetical protein
MTKDNNPIREKIIKGLELTQKLSTNYHNMIIRYDTYDE